MQHQKYLEIHSKWHQRLTEFFVSCLSNKEYMSCNNCLRVMRQISRFYPHYSSDNEPILKIVKNLSEDTSLKDLSTVAQRYHNIISLEINKRQPETSKKETKEFTKKDRDRDGDRLRDGERVRERERDRDVETRSSREQSREDSKRKEKEEIKRKSESSKRDTESYKKSRTDDFRKPTSSDKKRDKK